MNPTAIKLSPTRLRVLAHLADNGPSTVVRLSMALDIKMDTINSILSALLEAGYIERCAIGNMGGVRISEAGTEGSEER